MGGMDYGAIAAVLLECRVVPLLNLAKGTDRIALKSLQFHDLFAMGDMG